MQESRVLTNSFKAFMRRERDAGGLTDNIFDIVLVTAESEENQSRMASSLPILDFEFSFV